MATSLARVSQIFGISAPSTVPNTGSIAAYGADVASRTAEHNARERIEGICSSSSDATKFRVRVLDEIRRVVDYDAHVWLLTDPRTAVGSAPLADVPSLLELPETIRLKYLTTVNRWTKLHTDSVSVESFSGQQSETRVRAGCGAAF